MAVDTSQSATALLTEHLQYTPLSLIDDVINSVNSLIYQGVSSLENGLSSTPPERLGFSVAPRDKDAGAATGDDQEYPEAKQEIEEGLHKLETLLESTVDKNFDKFEIYVLRNILMIPEDLASWIRLGHYANLKYPPPPHAPTPQSVQLLRREVAASQTLGANLVAEASRNEAILHQLRAMTASPTQRIGSTPKSAASGQPNLAFLNTTPSSRALDVSMERSTQPLTTNTTFTVSQLPALKALLAELRPKLSSLKSADFGSSTARDERRQERLEYIEQRTKAHLDKNVRAYGDNAFQAGGRKIDKDELEALEKVASILGVP